MHRIEYEIVYIISHDGYEGCLRIHEEHHTGIYKAIPLSREYSPSRHIDLTY